jgi:DnaK suppressor protein
MASTDLEERVAARLSARRLGDLPRWRGRLEQLWRLQVEEIIELSLTYHEAASAADPDRQPESAETPGPADLQPILARTALAHQSLAEIEAALGRIDTARYGICQHCGRLLPESWLTASPQSRYCPDCRP